MIRGNADQHGGNDVDAAVMRSRMDRFEHSLDSLSVSVRNQGEVLSQIRGALLALKVILPLSIGAAWAVATLIAKGS